MRSVAQPAEFHGREARAARRALSPPVFLILHPVEGADLGLALHDFHAVRETEGPVVLPLRRCARGVEPVRGDRRRGSGHARRLHEGLRLRSRGLRRRFQLARRVRRVVPVALKHVRLLVARHGPPHVAALGVVQAALLHLPLQRVRCEGVALHVARQRRELRVVPELIRVYLQPLLDLGATVVGSVRSLFAAAQPAAHPEHVVAPEHAELVRAQHPEVLRRARQLKHHVAAHAPAAVHRGGRDPVPVQVGAQAAPPCQLVLPVKTPRLADLQRRVHVRTLAVRHRVLLRLHRYVHLEAEVFLGKLGFHRIHIVHGDIRRPLHCREVQPSHAYRVFLRGDPHLRDLLRRLQVILHEGAAVPGIQRLEGTVFLHKAVVEQQVLVVSLRVFRDHRDVLRRREQERNLLAPAHRRRRRAVQLRAARVRHHDRVAAGGRLRGGPLHLALQRAVVVCRVGLDEGESGAVGPVCARLQAAFVRAYPERPPEQAAGVQVLPGVVREQHALALRGRQGVQVPQNVAPAAPGLVLVGAALGRGRGAGGGIHHVVQFLLPPGPAVPAEALVLRLPYPRQLQRAVARAHRGAVVPEGREHAWLLQDL
mmetsp:Transcript_28159/g.71435  ORF Transcript_28159/g.71435 Transcript_28159/m.71435 type:complete len:596 (-) Transcript_28159:470-2257(-)